MTVSKELAKLLADAGIVVETEKVYFKGKLDSKKGILIYACLNGISEKNINFQHAPNSDDILSVLPARITYNSKVLQLEMYKEQNGYGYRYCKEGGDSVILSVHKSSSEALGNLALKLAEAGLLEVAR